MEEASGSVNCPHKIEDVLDILNKEISGSKNKRILPSVVLLLVDIDNLERVNRWYGRNTGNDVLSATAKILHRMLRPTTFSPGSAGMNFSFCYAGSP